MSVIKKTIGYRLFAVAYFFFVVGLQLLFWSNSYVRDLSRGARLSR